MKIDYADALKSGLKFCIQPKRWIPFFITDLAFASVALMLLLSNIDYLVYFFSGLENPAYFGSVLVFFVSFLGLVGGWVLINLWINGAVIHQSHKDDEFGKSWKISWKKYPSILAVGVITTFISILGNMVLGYVPIIGWVLTLIFAFIIALTFFFPYQAVIVRGSGFYKAIEDSVNIFKKLPFTVFVMWLMIAAISLLVIGLFSIPAIAFLFGTFVEASAGGTVSAAMSMFLEIQANLPVFAVVGIIFLLGLAIARTFSLKAQTEFYMQVKKRHG